MAGLYPETQQITAEEYNDFFFNMKKPWNREDLDYLVEWYSKEESLLSLAYALGRTPETVINIAGKLRKGTMKYQNEAGEYVVYESACNMAEKMTRPRDKAA